MPLIPQQDIIVISGPYKPIERSQEQAAELLKQALEAYPPCRIVSITGTGNLAAYRLTAVVETI